MASLLPIASADGMLARIAMPGSNSKPLTVGRFKVSTGYVETIVTRLDGPHLELRWRF